MFGGALGGNLLCDIEKRNKRLLFQGYNAEETKITCVNNCQEDG